MRKKKVNIKVKIKNLSGKGEVKEVKTHLTDSPYGERRRRSEEIWNIYILINPFYRYEQHIDRHS